MAKVSKAAAQYIPLWHGKLCTDIGAFEASEATQEQLAAIADKYPHYVTKPDHAQEQTDTSLSATDTAEPAEGDY